MRISSEKRWCLLRTETSSSFSLRKLLSQIWNVTINKRTEGRRRIPFIQRPTQSAMRCMKNSRSPGLALRPLASPPKGENACCQKHHHQCNFIFEWKSVFKSLPPNQRAVSVVLAAPSAGLFADHLPDNRFQSQGTPAAACLHWCWPQRAPLRWAASSLHAAGLIHSQSWHLRPYGPLAFLEIAAFSCVIKGERKKNPTKPKEVVSVMHWILQDFFCKTVMFLLKPVAITYKYKISQGVYSKSPLLKDVRLKI